MMIIIIIIHKVTENDNLMNDITIFAKNKKEQEIRVKNYRTIHLGYRNGIWE